MGKHSRCVPGVCDNEMRYPDLNKKHSIVNGDIVLHKLPKDGAVRTTKN